MQRSRKNISLVIAILFHGGGLIGILFTPYKDWFIQNIPVNFCLMALLLVWNQPRKNWAFFLFLIIAFIAGMGAGITGVQTGRLFGMYTYGTILGPKLYEVPWIIGLNWFIIVFCCGSVMMQMQQWFRRRFEKAGSEMPARVASMSLIVDGALLAVLFDWIMEPVAIKLGFWQWQEGAPPYLNYLCWFAISALLLVLYRKLPFTKPNHFAVHLLIIQALFFGILRTYL
jgi:putative membrane protein